VCFLLTRSRRKPAGGEAQLCSTRRTVTEHDISMHYADVLLPPRARPGFDPDRWHFFSLWLQISFIKNLTEHYLFINVNRYIHVPPKKCFNEMFAPFGCSISSGWRDVMVSTAYHVTVTMVTSCVDNITSFRLARVWTIEDLQWRHAMTSSTDVRHIGGIFYAPRGSF
jgi:hypothetical protein